LESYKKITEHPVKKCNSFLSVFLHGESINKKKRRKKVSCSNFALRAPYFHSHSYA
jgi:hypothetical protein